ncbi:hypothetical protein ACJMK2_012244 [Sinanodonta woodiana]|uniref:Uncharacterized protein n=1 Tax=Sinanodonta woodiana TaxID=1069815 RepID=A0ABD3V7V7_SINWO
MSIGATNSLSGIMESDVPVHVYEKLRDATGPSESAYSSIDHSIINFVPALQSIEGELRILEDNKMYRLGRK